MDQHTHLKSGVIGFLSTDILLPLIPFILLMLAVLFISSLIVWPYMLTTVSSVEEASPFITGIMYSGLAGFTVTVLIVVCLAVFSEKLYTAEGSVTLCTWLCPITTWVAMALLRVSPFEIGMGQFSALMSIIVLGVIGLVISAVPTVVAIVIGWTVRIICGLISRK